MYFTVIYLGLQSGSLATMVQGNNKEYNRYKQCKYKVQLTCIPSNDVDGDPFIFDSLFLIAIII